MKSTDKVKFIALLSPVWETRIRIFIGDGSEDAYKDVRNWIRSNLEYECDEFTNLEDLIDKKCQGCAFELKIHDTERREIKHCIYLRGFNGSIHSFSILNHEMYHLVNQALRYAGMEATPESEEAFTYYYDWLTEILYSELESLGLCNRFREDKSSDGYSVINTIKSKTNAKG